MSRFGNSGTFFYSTASDAMTSVATFYLDASQMPQYPFKSQTITDRTTYRSKNGKSWMYENYNLNSYLFRWTMIDETKRNSLRTMYDARGLVSFMSGTNSFGTFRIADSSWKDEEVSHELYDLSFTLEETV